MAPRLRLALVVPGAVSLGAYEAGVLTALLSVVRRSGGRVVVDTIVGSSAGSISGAVLAHALLTGAGDRDLEDVWIRTASIDNLLKASPRGRGRRRAPFGTEAIQRSITAAWSKGPGVPPSAEPIAFVASIANLNGLRYRFASSARARAVEVETHRDYRAFELGPGTDWNEVGVAAVASGAICLAFPPVELTRRRAEFPPNVFLDGDEVAYWYTDGSTVVNEPLGMAADAVFAPHQLGLPARGPQSGDRMFLLVHPHPLGFQAWPPQPGAPPFFAVARRAAAITRRQSIHDDLRRMEEANRRLEVRRELQRALNRLLASDSPEVREQVAAALSSIGAVALRSTARIRAATEGGTDRRHLKRLTEDVAARSPGPLAARDLLDFVLDEATGTAGRGIARVEVVSPELDPTGQPASALLAGDPLGHFFGLASEEARRSDFGLGYRNFRAWWEGYAAARPRSLADLAPEEHPLERVPPAGRLSMRDLPLGRRLKLAAWVAWRFLREVV